MGAALQRTFAVDALECPECHGRMRVIADIHEAEIASAILDGLGISDEVPAWPERATQPTTTRKPTPTPTEQACRAHVDDRCRGRS